MNLCTYTHIIYLYVCMYVLVYVWTCVYSSCSYRHQHLHKNKYSWVFLTSEEVTEGQLVSICALPVVLLPKKKLAQFSRVGAIWTLWVLYAKVHFLHISSWWLPGILASTVHFCVHGLYLERRSVYWNLLAHMGHPLLDCVSRSWVCT